MSKIITQKIGQYIDQLTGFPFESSRFNQNGTGYRLLRGINVTRGNLRFDSDNEMFYEDEKMDFSKYLLKENDIVISMDGSLVGRNFAKVKESFLPLLLVQRVARIRTNPEFLNQDYLYQFFTSEYFIKYVDSVKTSSGIPHISSKQINDFEIPILPIQEQVIVAEILGTYDQLIQNISLLISKKERKKTGLIQTLLGEKVRFKEFSKEKWIETTLGEVCDLIIDGTHQTPKYQESGIPFYSVESITKNDFKNTKFISEAEHLNLTKKFKIEKGDILMTRIGSIGDAKLIDWDVNASFYVTLVLLKIKKTMSSRFIYQLIKTENFKKELLSRSLLSAVPLKINLGEITHTKIRIPTNLKEQDKIAEVLSSSDEEVIKLKSQLSKIKLQKKGLMQLLLSGKLRVNTKK